MHNYNVLKQPVITKVVGKGSKKAQSRELLKSVAVSVSPKLKKITLYNKANNRKIRERIGRTENPKTTACVPNEKLSAKIKTTQQPKCKKKMKSMYQPN